MSDQQSNDAPKYVTSAFLAKRYSIHPTVIARYGSRGVLPRVHLGGRAYRYPLAECDAAMASRIQPLAQG